MGCGPLPDWLRNECCIYSIDTFDNNLCAWRCLAMYKRKDIQRGTEFVTRTALNLAREYYGDSKLKRKDVRPTKLVDFESIGKHHNVNIMFFEPKRIGERMQDLYGGYSMVRFSTKTTCPQKIWDYWKVTVFTSKRWVYFVNDGNVKVVSRYLRETRT